MIFVINVIRQARCIRRVEDFIQHGFDTKVYGFDREGDNRLSPKFNHKIVGVVSHTMTYFQRLRWMIKILRNIIKENESNNKSYYLFNLDIAIAFYFAGGWNKGYYYEVSDLMELGVKNSFIQFILKEFNKLIIRRSKETIFTSTGFINYLFHKNSLDNAIVIPNKLNKKCLQLPFPKTKKVSIDTLVIGFTGAIRNDTIINFIDVIGQKFPQIQLRLYGNITCNEESATKFANRLDGRYDNIHFFGPFKNPDDFPVIYSEIDMVLSLYSDVGNDKYLEPNKLFEAIFYEKPIIVSENSYVGDTVNRMGVGFVINGSSHKDIENFLNNLTIQQYMKCVEGCLAVKKEELIDNTEELFIKISK